MMKNITQLEDAQELVMVHRVLKSVSSVVRNDHWARYCLKMDDGSSNPKKRNLGGLRMWCVDLQTRFKWTPCVVLAVSPVQDEECEAHAAFLVESEGFGVLDCGATTSFGSVEGDETVFSKSHEHDTRFPEVDPFIIQLWRWCFIKSNFPVQTHIPR